jgi:hypothetical protein
VAEGGDAPGGTDFRWEGGYPTGGWTALSAAQNQREQTLHTLVYLANFYPIGEGMLWAWIDEATWTLERADIAGDYPAEVNFNTETKLEYFPSCTRSCGSTSAGRTSA